MRSQLEALKGHLEPVRGSLGSTHVACSSHREISAALTITTGLLGAQVTTAQF